MKISQTKNYALFVNDTTNRPITDKDKSSLKKLEASMKEYGFLPFPILVFRTGEKLRVIDGNHRLTMAQKLSLPVLYVETEREDISISACAAGQTPWKLDHFVGSWAAQGRKPYEELLRFASDNGIPIGRATSLLSGNGGAGGNLASRVKSGEFTIKASPYASRVMRMVDAVRAQQKWGANSHSMNALSRMTYVKDFDDERFISKVRAHPHLLKSQSTVEAFSEMYDEVYNHAARTRLPLAFLAREAATKRSAAGPSK